MSGVVKFNRGGFLAQRVITAFFHYKETQETHSNIQKFPPVRVISWFILMMKIHFIPQPAPTPFPSYTLL